MATTYTLARNGSTGNLYLKNGGIVAFFGDPVLYDGEFFRRSITVASGTVVRLHNVENNYKSQINISYDVSYDLSPLAGTWNLAVAAYPPFKGIGGSSENYYRCYPLPAINATLSNPVVTPSNGKTFVGSPLPYLSQGGQITSARLSIKQTNLGRWDLVIAGYEIWGRMLFRFTDGSGDDYSKHFTATSLTFGKSNSQAAGHSVRGTYSAVSLVPAGFSVVSGSIVVSA